MSNVLLDHFGRVAGNTSGSKFLIISVIRSYKEHWVQRVIMAHLLYLHQSFVCYLLYDKRMILLLLVYSYVAKKSSISFVHIPDRTILHQAHIRHFQGTDERKTKIPFGISRFSF